MHCREKERIAFNYLTSQKYSGEQAVLDIWREKKAMQVTVQLSRPRFLVPLHLANQDPSFFVVAGLVLAFCFGLQADIHCSLAEACQYQLPCLHVANYWCFPTRNSSFFTVAGKFSATLVWPTS